MNNLSPYKTIYTDLDYVLHNFTPDFVRAAKELYSIDIAEEKYLELMSKNENFVSPIKYYSKQMGLNDKQVEEIVQCLNSGCRDRRGRCR